MFEMRAIGVALAAVWLGAACGDDGMIAPGDAGQDAALDATLDAAADAEVWSGPVPPVAPRFEPCPAGWRLASDATGAVLGCDPWPADGRATCPDDQTHFPGEPGCTLIGSPCPAGEFPEALPAGATVLYVRAGATGGDGSATAPYGTVDEAIAVATPGTIIALAKGTHPGGFRLTLAVTLWGACAAETTIMAGKGLARTPIWSQASGVVVQNLTVEGGPIFIGRGSMQVRGVISQASLEGGINVMNGSVHVERVLVRDADEAALELLFGTTGTVRGLVAERCNWGSLFTSSAELDAEDVVAWDTRAGAEYAVQIDAGHVALARYTSDGPGAWYVNSGARVEARDLWLRGGTGAPRTADALQFFGASHGTLTRLHSEGAWFGAIVAAESSDLGLEDVVIVAPVAHGGGNGRGLDVGGALLTARRTRIDGASELGIFGGPGARLVLEDVTVRDTRSDAMGETGRGVQLQQGASLEGMRVALVGNREAAILAASIGTTAHFVDLDVRDTLERSCVASGCPGAGIGIGAYTGAAISLERTRVTHSAYVGLQIAAAGAIDAHVGEVSDSPIGANVQVMGFDFARISDRMVYVRNGTNLDSNELPVPDMTPLPP